MQTETKDFMSGIIARSKKDASKGIGPKSDKKNSLLDIIGEDELQIIDDSSFAKKTAEQKTGVCQWKDIRGGNYFHKVPPDLWTDKKFFSYFRSLCVKKNKSLGDTISASIGPALHARFIKKIKEELSKKIDSSLSNQILKNYIEWFVNEEMKVDSFDLYDICARKYFNKFVSLNKHKETQVQPIVDSKIDLSKIEDYYNSGGVAFLMNYGVVVCFSWLLSNKKLSLKESKEIIQSFYQDAVRSGPAFVEKIKEVTKKLSPYSEKDYSAELNELLNSMAIKEISFVLNK